MDTNKKENIVRIIFLIIAIGVGTLVFWTGGILLYHIIKAILF
jgi:hypothetical protein